MEKKVSSVVCKNPTHPDSTLKINTVFLAVFFFVSISSILCNPKTACAGNEKNLYLVIESFTWKEFSDDEKLLEFIGDEKLLEESGPLYGLGFSGSMGGNPSQPFAFHYKIEGFMGYIGYDGHALEVQDDQIQGVIPITTNIRYLGLKTELGLGYKIFIGESGLSFEPFAGLGYRGWLRDITDTSSELEHVSGYEEFWQSFYGRLGARFDKRMSEQFKIFTEAAAIVPFYNQNMVDLGGTIKLEPGNKISLWAETGLKFKRFRFSLFYEGLRFSESDIVRVGPGLFLQPKSEADIFGVNIGFTF